jgi:hypothetical protein
VFVAGGTDADLGGGSAGGGDAWLARYSGAGARTWIRQFGSSSFDGATALTPDGSGGVFVAGFTGGNLGGPNAGESDVWLAAYDSAGDRAWITQFGSSAEDWVYGLAPDSLGGAFLAGYTFGGLDGANAGFRDIWLALYAGDPADVALLTDFTVAFGSLISGGLQDLVESDDLRLRTRSIPGFTAQEANLMELRVGAETTVQNPGTIDLTLEGRISQPGGTVRVRLRNWSNNAFVQIHQYPIGTTETVETIEDIVATNFVRASDGRIEVSMRHSVFATFSVLGFDSYTDQVEIAVQ